MVMRDIGSLYSFNLPGPRFISRGTDEGNKPGQGEIVTCTCEQTAGK